MKKYMVDYYSRITSNINDSITEAFYTEYGGNSKSDIDDVIRQVQDKTNDEDVVILSVYKSLI